MQLATELLKRLNDEEVPIEIRVKIAQNALISSDFQFIEKEDVVINWFCGKIKQNLLLWSQLHASLTTSIHYISNPTKKKLIKLIIKQLKNNVKDPEKVALHLIESSIFTHYFKQNTSEFISLNSCLFEKINSEKEIEFLLNNIKLYYNHSNSKEEFTKAFIKKIIPSFFNIFSHPSNSDKVIDCISHIVFTNNVHQNLKKLASSNNEDSIEDKNDILIELFNLLMVSYNKEVVNDNNVFQKIVSAFLSAYRTDNLCILYFYSSLFHLLQLKSMKTNLISEIPQLNYEKSLAICHSILLPLISLNLDWNIQIQNVSFTDYIKDLIISLLKINGSFDLTVKILIIFIKLTPVAIESILNEILPFVLLAHKDENGQKAYILFISELLAMFSKLHRENKFISVLLKSAETLFNSPNTQISPLLCVDDILPEDVKNNFSASFEELSSKNYIAIFRTLSFQLNNGIVEILDSKTCDSAFVLLINVEIDLIITFLRSVSAVEDTTPEASFIRFITCMNDFQQILSKLGTKLLNMEHRCDIMSSFLNLCYVWAELYITVLHYNTHPLDIETPASNISMLFGYFTKEEWKSLEQRIVNFGELRCKQILRKIHIQKTRAKILLTGYEEINKKNQYTLFTYDLMNLFNETFEENMDMNTIAEKIVFEIKTNQNQFQVLQSDIIRKNRKLILSMLTHCLTLIYKEMKIKRKHTTNSTNNAFLIRKLLKIDIENIINAESVDFSQICGLFSMPITEPSDVKINDDNIIFYLTLIKNLSMMVLNDSTKTYILLVSMALYSDFKNLNSHNVTLASENLFSEIAQSSYPKSFVEYMSLEILLQYIQNYQHCDSLVCKFIETKIKQEKVTSKLAGSIKKLKSLMSYDKLVNIVNTFIMTIGKLKKDKLDLESQLIYDKIWSKLMSLTTYILNNDNFEIDKFIGAYAMIVNKSCEQDDSTLKQFLDKFEMFFHFALQTLKESTTSTNLTLFLNVIIKHRHKLTPFLPQDFVIQCAIACKDPSAMNFLYLTEISTKSEFEVIINNKILEANHILKSEDLNCIGFVFNTWKNIILASTSAEKNLVKYKAIEHVLDEILFAMRDNYEWCQGVLDLCQVMLQCKQMELSPVMIDVLFQILAEIKYPYGSSYENINQFAILFKSVLKNMGTLISFRAVLVMDKIPSILQIYRILLKELCHRSSSNFEIEFKETLYQTAHEFLKFNESLIKHKREFTRLAPYLIADILQYYEHVNFYPEIKDYLNQCLYELLGICDNHTYPFLLRNMSAPSQEIFKTVNDEYKKFYRFTGKS